jgi:spore coat polysaccharide biosynthesis protein SpsF
MIAIIQARTNSKRFPNKVIKKIGDITILEQVINQVNQVFKTKEIIVATSKNKSDIKICKICKKKGIRYYRGDLKNVSKRYYDVLKKFKSKSFIRICADSPFIDPILIKRCIKIFNKKKPDFLTNLLPRSFPKGQSIEIFKSKIYLKGFKNITNNNDKEHVTTYFYKNKKQYKYINTKNNLNLSKISMCIDFPKDLINANKAINKLKDYKKTNNWKNYLKFFK